MPDLLTRLTAAPEGSREFDAEIAEAIGIRVVQDGEEFYDWPPRRTEGEDGGPNGFVADYTTSLDAALPGENITNVIYDHIAGVWHAVHFTGSGSNFRGIAHTEPLARRIAYLRSMAEAAECPECKGWGKQYLIQWKRPPSVHEENCPDCDGTGLRARYG